MLFDSTRFYFKLGERRLCAFIRAVALDLFTRFVMRFTLLVVCSSAAIITNVPRYSLMHVGVCLSKIAEIIPSYFEGMYVNQP